MAGQYRGFSELQKFALPDARLTGKQLGKGSFGCVVELKVNGTLCAGKRFHNELLDPENTGFANIRSKFLHECQVISANVRIKEYICNASVR